MSENRVAKYWDNSSDNWYKQIDYYIEIIKKNPKIAFPPKVYELLCEKFMTFDGLKVLVPSSGDNVAAFAFHLLGAKVTSVDISKKQIENARKTAKKRNWDMEFICDDSMHLSKIEINAYDLIYTSNGVHVWINDLVAMYSSFNRVLKEDGIYVFFDTHPFSRPFDDSGDEIKIVKDYKDVGPLPDENGIEYAWRIEDYVNALVSSGFMINKMTEFNSTKNDLDNYDYIYNSKKERLEDNGRLYNWKENPWAALPQCLGMSVKKHKNL